MEIEKYLVEHYKRWNIQFSYEEEFEKFKNRLLEALNSSIGDALANTLKDVDKNFSRILIRHKGERPSVRKSEVRLKLESFGSKILPPSLDLEKNTYFTPPAFGDTAVYRCIDASTDSKELAFLVQTLFFALEEKYDELPDEILELAENIKQISLLTPSVGFQISIDKRVILYPVGDAFLDIKIINFVLSGLQAYPNAAKHFELALKIYMDGDTTEYRHVLDNLRFAYEQLLKTLFGDRSLENQKNALLAYFATKGVHKEVVNLHHTLFAQYVKYQNDAVKHAEQYSLKEVEFIIYLTGNFMRLILELEK